MVFFYRAYLNSDTENDGAWRSVVKWGDGYGSGGDKTIYQLLCAVKHASFVGFFFINKLVLTTIL